MRPAFSSAKAAAAFALLLLVVLLSPVLAGKKFLPPREQAYAVPGWGNGPYPWIRHQIFEETNDIDIVFMGSSHILHAVDTPYVQARLSQRLGRPAVVRTLAWGGAGYDALYGMAQELMAHRQVRMLVFYDENTPANRSSSSVFWFRFGENARLLAGLPLGDKALFYFASVLGMPRNLLGLIRQNIPAPLVTTPPNYWEQHYQSANLVQLLGCTRSELGFNYDPHADSFTKFTPYTPQTKVSPADTEIYSPADPKHFVFGREPLPAWQVHFCREIADLARTHHTRLVMLHIPVLADAPDTTLAERAFWPDIFGRNFSLVGVVPARLFGGLTDEQLHWLFTNSAHFNENGMVYFTPLITPALLKLYETSATN
jgi:hypothetical protein